MSSHWRARFDLAGLALGAGLSVAVAGVASSAQADAPMPATSALVLSEADGTVRARAGVQVAISGASGTTDRTLAFRPIVHARMAAVRQCFASAIGQNSRVSGRVTYNLQVSAPQKLSAKLVRDEIHDSFATQCVEMALAAGSAGSLPRGARVQVSVAFDNPVVRLGVVDPTQRLAEVRVLGTGVAETSGATQNNEVRFNVQASAYARAALGKLGARANAELAGLLDCRRKSSRRYRAAQGTLTMSSLIAEGQMRDVRVLSNTVGDRKSPVCVSAWLAKLDVQDLEKVGLNVAVTFSK